MPRPDPTPSARHSVLAKVRRISRLLTLFSMAIAALAVVLVARGGGGDHIHMMVATALGVGLTVLVGTGLMTLVFLSARSGHDEQTRGDAREETE